MAKFKKGMGKGMKADEEIFGPGKLGGGRGKMRKRAGRRR